MNLFKKISSVHWGDCNKRVCKLEEVLKKNNEAIDELQKELSFFANQEKSVKETIDNAIILERNKFVQQLEELQKDFDTYRESKKVITQENERLLGELQEQKVIYNYAVADLENKNSKLKEKIVEQENVLGSVCLDDIFEAKSKDKIEIKVSKKENGKRSKKQ